MRRAYRAIHSPTERDPSGTRFAPAGGSGLPSPASTSSDVPSGNTSSAASPRPVLIWWMSRTPGAQAGSGSPTVCEPAVHGSRKAVSIAHPHVLICECDFASIYSSAPWLLRGSRGLLRHLSAFNGPLTNRDNVRGRARPVNVSGIFARRPTGFCLRLPAHSRMLNAV